MKHYKPLALVIAFTLSGALFAQQPPEETPSLEKALQPDLEPLPGDTPTIALSAPTEITTQVLLDGDKRTVAQCKTELEVKKEIFSVVYRLRGSSSNDELWDTLSPSAQKLVGDDLNEITIWAAEDDFKINHMICNQLHPDTFPPWNKNLLSQIVESQKSVKKESNLKHRIPVVLNYTPPPEAFRAEVVLRGDVAIKAGTEKVTDSGTD